jgi:NADH-quinone oxidoreductase subunit L
MAFSQQLFLPFREAPLAAGAGLVAAVLGFLAALALYRTAVKDPLPQRLGALSGWMQHRFYFDELYEATFIRGHDALAAVAGWVDRWIIGGVVTVTHGTTELAGRALRLVQTGNLQTYTFFFALGVAVVLWYVLR